MGKEKSMRELTVDIDALLAAFEYNSDDISYYLDLETGRVIMVSDDIRWELEAIYEEFYLPDSTERFDLKQILQQRALPEWHQQALLQADDVEEYYIRRYIDVPYNDTSIAYRTMQNFINTLSDKALRQKMWHAISGEGAFRHFKTLLAKRPQLRKRWFAFSAKQARQRVLDWLRTEGIQLAPAAQATTQTSSTRTRLIAEVLTFVRAARKIHGVTRIALIGSLTTHKADPKDADLLVTLTEDADLPTLAELGRKLIGHTQSFNRGADIFLADEQGNYLGRTCPWKHCQKDLHRACDALHCGEHAYLHDDLHTLRLSSTLIVAPPLELWPEIVTRTALPQDIQFNLIAPLRAEKP